MISAGNFCTKFQRAASSFAPSKLRSRSFIENNYIEAGGNVEKLLRLLELTEYQFRKRLNEEFGATPKEWLTEKMKTEVLHLAKKNETTPTEIARKLHISQTKFFKFCRKHFDRTATELIARVQGESKDICRSFIDASLK